MPELKAYRGWYGNHSARPVILAETPGKARAAVFRSVRDYHDSSVEFTEVRVRRSPGFDDITEHSKTSSGVPYKEHYAKLYKSDLESSRE